MICLKVSIRDPYVIVLYFNLILFPHLYIPYIYKYIPPYSQRVEIKRDAFAASLQTTLRTFAQRQQVLHNSPASWGGGESGHGVRFETKNIKYTSQRKSILY